MGLQLQVLVVLILESLWMVSNGHAKFAVYIQEVIGCGCLLCSWEKTLDSVVKFIANDEKDMGRNVLIN